LRPPSFLETKVIKQLSKDRQRLLALSLLLLGLVLVLATILVPLINVVATYNESIEDLQFELLRYKRIAAGKGQVLQYLDRLKREQGDQNHFSDRATPALASADLQQLIKKVVVDAGGRLLSTQVVPETEEDHFVRTSIKVQMSGDTMALRSVLHDIETARPMLIIDNLTIRAISARRDPRTRKLLPSNELNVNFDVSGYMRTLQN
jgi:general secretion pathway protein M